MKHVILDMFFAANPLSRCWKKKT